MTRPCCNYQTRCSVTYGVRPRVHACMGTPAEVLSLVVHALQVLPMFACTNTRTTLNTRSTKVVLTLSQFAIYIRHLQRPSDQHVYARCFQVRELTSLQS